ncbi:MFS transporter [Paenibacillus taichungensis]|uniref:MFS transporter n=1 Tax=Paenibacillus TaxID=44249 RepID=UPI00091BF61E|nr:MULTISPECIES: MFS transporter [unclassified Paenibacillus]PIH61519.1 MFS transporter [Paenibacillus sp. LK1]SHN86669.1 MFS transporter, DHA1 family, purine base/nucleoside efflux pump [Paenibacillus sp. ov031]
MSNALKIYMLAIISFLVGTSEYIIAGILDKVAADVGVSVSVAGQLITVFSLAYAFGTPIVIAVTARMERRKLLLYALGVFAVGNLIAVALPGFTFLLVSRIVLAISTGVFLVTSLTVAAKLAAPGKQGSAIATLIMGFSASLIIGVPLGRVAASVYDWKLIFGVIGLLGLFAMFLILIAIPQSNGEAPVPIRKQFALLKKPEIAIALVVAFMWIGGYSVVYTYISPYLLTITKLSEQSVSIALFSFGIASLFGSKFGGYSTDRWGAPRTLVIGMLFNTMALVLLSLDGQSPLIVFPLLMFWSFTVWSSSPTQQFYLLSLAPEASGIMLSMNTSVLHLGMAAGAGLGGVVVEQASLSYISWIGATSVILAAVTAATFFRISYLRKRREEVKCSLVETCA